MIIDEKGRLFSKISIVDIAVVLFVVCALFFVGIKFVAPAQNISQDTKGKYIVEFKVNNIRQASVDAIEKSMGQNVYDLEKTRLGKLSEITEVTPYEIAVTKTDGSMVMAEVPDKYTLKANIEVDGMKSADSLMVANVREISVGSQLTIGTKEITVEVVITGIKEK